MFSTSWSRLCAGTHAVVHQQQSQFLLDSATEESWAEIGLLKLEVETGALETPNTQAAAGPCAIVNPSGNSGRVHRLPEPCFRLAHTPCFLD